MSYEYAAANRNVDGDLGRPNMSMMSAKLYPSKKLRKSRARASVRQKLRTRDNRELFLFSDGRLPSLSVLGVSSLVID